MSDFGLSNTPLIKDLYNTAEEALIQAAVLGINGYRTYNINGETKYVPGATYIEYEKAMQLIRVQGKIASRGDEVFGGNLVGYQFTTKTAIEGDPYLTFGNFSISTSTNQAVGQDIINNDQPRKFTQKGITDKITEVAETAGVTIRESFLIDDITSRIEENQRVKVNFDKRKFENYVLFSSLKERIKQSIQEILQGFPAAMHLVPVSILYPSIEKCEQYVNDNQSIITINSNTILNPFGIEFTKNGLNKVDSDEITKLRNFSKTYTDYVVLYDGVEYPILSAVLPTAPTDSLKLIIQGLPFQNIINSTQSINVELYIKPTKKQFIDFYEGLSDLPAFLLNVGGDGGYVANIYVPFENDNNEIVNQINTIAFPMYDQINIDIIGDAFDEYITTLHNIADEFDRFKTNIIARFLTTESLQEFDTEDRRFNVILQVYGRMFDQVKQYIDGLTYMRNVSYDNVENIPDALVKNFARMIGFKTFEIQDEETLIKSLFDFSNDEVESDITPAELDIEIWRRILTNAFHLFKSKGTRKSIEFVMQLIGVPESIVEINEYIYLSDSKIDPVQINKGLYGSNINILSASDYYPMDDEGYPTVPKDTYYQSNGGNLRIDEENIGPYDFGKDYIDKYKKFADNVFGFDMYKTIDNQKSWVESTSDVYRENYQPLRHTDYIERDSRLSVNSKEIDIFISLGRVFDVYPYRYFLRNKVDIDSTLSSVYKNPTLPRNLTFDQYLKEIINNTINVRNRKTIQTYPTLSKVYFDYLKELGNSESYIDFRKSMEFINKFDTYWVKFIEQFLPATAIVNAGKKIDNSIHFQNKFKHRHGKNSEIGWKGTDGSEFQTTALKPVNFGTIHGGKASGMNHQTYTSFRDIFDITGEANKKYTGIYDAIGDYNGIQYSISDYCEFSGYVHVWNPEINYNTNVYQSGRLGVFVIHNNKLYRLKSNPTQSITGEPGEPNGTDFEYINPYTDGNDVNFADCPNPTVDERDYFVDIIGFGFAYKTLDADFDCPPPKPHVCYFDFYGKPIVIPNNTVVTYTDDSGTDRKVYQPKFYGYSRNTATAEPEDAEYGYANFWALPYIKPMLWASGTTYYENDIVTLNGLNYRVTKTTLGQNLITNSLVTTQNTGLYQNYEARDKTDPFMHITPALINHYEADPLKDKISINLTKDLDLFHIFSGSTVDTTYKVIDNIIEDQIYISDSISVKLDGFYPTTENSIGSGYVRNEEDSFRNTVSDRLLLKPDVNNYVDLRSFSTGFTNESVNFVLNEDLPGYYLVNNTSYLTFDFDLYFESDFTEDIKLMLYLVNQNSKVLNQEEVTINGSDTVANRIIKFTAENVFYANQRVYLVIKPITHACSLVRFEEIKYEFKDVESVGDYKKLDDIRFRLNFNGGRSINDAYYYDPVISISPVSDVFSATTKYFKNENDEVITLLSGIDELAHLRNSNYNEISFTENITPGTSFNTIYDPYYKKYKSDSRLLYTSQNRHKLDNQIGYDKIDFTFEFQTRKIPPNTSINSKKIIGQMIPLKINVKDFYLGNTPVDVYGAQISKNIIIGKNPGKRIVGFDGSITVNNVKETIFSYTSGISDYTELDYETGSNYYDTNYIKNSVQDRTFGIVSGFTRDIDRSVPNKNVLNSEIYQEVLKKAEYYSKNITNYKINDVVKYKDKVLGADILYVCVCDAQNYHFDENGCKIDNQINGSHSIFVEITKYNVRNYEITGYKDTSSRYNSKSNVHDYNDKRNIVQTVGPGDLVNVLKPGQIIKYVDGSTVKYHRLVYNKSLIYTPGTSYNSGDFILYNGEFYLCKQVWGIQNALTPDLNIWFKFNPFTTDILTPSGMLAFANMYRLPDVEFIKVRETSGIISPALTYTSKPYFERVKRYNGEPIDRYVLLGGGTYQSLSKPDIYQLPNPSDPNSIESGTSPYFDYSGPWYNSNVTGLFEVINDEVNCPLDFDITKRYNVVPSTNDLATFNAQRMSDNKVLYNNSLYSFIGTGVNTLTGNPVTDTANWERKDFMLASSISLYKERTSVKVYDGDAISLTDEMKSNLKMYNNDLTYKTGFSKNSFNGSTINEKLVNGLNMYYDSKDSNRRLIQKYGQYGLRREQNNLMLDYYYERDSFGALPITGEFIGLLRISNPCGHSASVVLGSLFTNKTNSLRTIKAKDLSISLVSPENTVPYTIRMIFNQKGIAKGTISWSGAANGSVVIDENNQYDEPLVLEANKELVVTITYNVANKQTSFGYALLNEVDLFPKPNLFGDNLYASEHVTSQASFDSNTRIETRKITFKAISQNYILQVGLDGIEKPGFEGNVGFINRINL